MEQKFAGYSLSFSPMFTGRVAAIVAARKNGLADLEGEVYLLVERGQRLHSTSVACDLEKIPEDMKGQFDSEFMLNEALGIAESGVATLRLSEFEKTKDERLFSSPVSHSEIRRSAFGWATELAIWTKELGLIADQTENAALREWLQLVRLIRSFLIVTPRDLAG